MTEPLAASDSPPLAYASPSPRASSPLWAGVFISLIGLALIGLGGCFLIGVMMLVTNINVVGSKASPGTLTAILYVLAFACFGAAIILLVIGLRSLLSIVRRM